MEEGEPEESTTTTDALIDEDKSVDDSDGGGAITGQRREPWSKNTGSRN